MYKHVHIYLSICTRLKIHHCFHDKVGSSNDKFYVHVFINVNAQMNRQMYTCVNIIFKCISCAHANNAEEYV